MAIALHAEQLAERAQFAAALVARIRQGDSDAEADLVARYSRGVTFLLRGLTGDSARADDLHQETFQLVIEKVRAGELRQPEKLPGFIRGLAKNLFIAECRRQAKHRDEPVDETRPVADPEASVLQQMLRRENGRLVRRLLAELEPPRYRELLFRFYLAGESKEQLCAELDLTNLHFNRVIFRARQRLKELIEDAAQSPTMAAAGMSGAQQVR